MAGQAHPRRHTLTKIRYPQPNTATRVPVLHPLRGGKRGARISVPEAVVVHSMTFAGASCGSRAIVNSVSKPVVGPAALRRASLATDSCYHCADRHPFSPFPPRYAIHWPREAGRESLLFHIFWVWFRPVKRALFWLCSRFKLLFRGSFSPFTNITRP